MGRERPMTGAAPAAGVGPTVLGLRALGLGDFCCAVPAWKALRRAFPSHRTVLAAPAWQRQLVELCPAIDELCPSGELEPLPSAVHDGDLAVNLHGRGPRSTQLLAATSPRRLVTFAAPDGPPGAGAVAWDGNEHDVARWCRLVASLGIPVDPTDLWLARPAVDPPTERATVLHPGASAPARRWPASRWAEVASILGRAGHRVVLTGSAADAPLTAAIASRAALAPRADLAGRTDLTQLAALVADARLVICGDTGVAHLASAYATRSILLFGPTSPATWGPPADGPHRVIWMGRTGDPHGVMPDPGLLDISVDDVIDAFQVLSALTVAR
ncbi:MAG: glycosyl transferase, family 9 [Acidimicrobiales bacterium]|nr:glycosyl transferase, family 9 [Acidimicrobiales bacterium]